MSKFKPFFRGPVLHPATNFYGNLYICYIRFVQSCLNRQTDHTKNITSLVTCSILLTLNIWFLSHSSPDHLLSLPCQHPLPHIFSFYSEPTRVNKKEILSVNYVYTHTEANRCLYIRIKLLCHYSILTINVCLFFFHSPPGHLLFLSLSTSSCTVLPFFFLYSELTQHKYERISYEAIISINKCRFLPWGSGINY